MDSTVEKWIDAINGQSIEQLTSLATEDHSFFVDGESPTLGRSKVASSWKGYFKAFPSYHIFIDESYAINKIQYLVGHTSGSHVPEELESVAGSVIWKCVVTMGKVEEWSIYPGTKDNRQLFGIPSNGI
jgi:hypothetical protein